MVIDASYCAAPLTSAMQLGLMDSTSCQWKPKWEMAQLLIKVVAEEKKADAELFQILAEAIGKNNVALSEKSEWSKKNDEHTFVQLLAYYRGYSRLSGIFPIFRVGFAAFRFSS